MLVSMCCTPQASLCPWNKYLDSSWTCCATILFKTNDTIEKIILLFVTTVRLYRGQCCCSPGVKLQLVVTSQRLERCVESELDYESFSFSNSTISRTSVQKEKPIFTSLWNFMHVFATHLVHTGIVAYKKKINFFRDDPLLSPTFQRLLAAAIYSVTRWRWSCIFFPRCFADCNVYSPVGGSGDRCACLICKRYLQTSTLQDAVVTGKETRLMDSTAWRRSLNTLQTAFKLTPLAPACRTRGGTTQFLTVKRSLSRASRTWKLRWQLQVFLSRFPWWWEKKMPQRSQSPDIKATLRGNVAALTGANVSVALARHTGRSWWCVQVHYGSHKG